MKIKKYITISALLAGVSFASPVVLHSFDVLDGDGAVPAGSLVLNGGMLYGSTQFGGSDSFGSVFQISTNGSGHAVLHDFSGATPDGAVPWSSPVLSGSTLYGVTPRGGLYTTGTVYSLTTSGTLNILHDFSGAADGGRPWGGLIQDGSVLYGCTRTGGSSGEGTVFKINADGSGFTLLHSFSTGEQPFGELTLVNDVLYGMTFSGGSNDFGTVFRIGTDGSAFSILHHFAGGPWDGSLPRGALTYFDDRLYGMTPFGGSDGYGTVFGISTNGNGYSVLHNFDGTQTDGAHPYGSLVRIDELLYGMTSYGGISNNGTLFRVRIDGADYELLDSFSDGIHPHGTPVINGDILYGMTSAGGDSDDGTVFSFDIPEPMPGPPVASFAASPVVGSVPLTVTFTSTAIGDVSGFFWNFGDGFTTNTTSSTVTRTYDVAGSYTVRLTAFGAGGNSTITQTDLVKATEPPVGILALYDPFDEAVSSSATPTNWVLAASGGGEHSRIDAGSLTYPDLLDSVGNSWGLGQGTADYERPVSGISGLTDGEHVYYSFLMRLNSPLDAFNAGMFRLYNTNDLYGSGLCVGWGTSDYTSNLMGFSLSNRNKNYSSGVSDALEMTDEIYTAADTTYLIVLGYNRGAGAVGSSVQLWVNPDSSSFGTTNPPAATITMPSYQNTSAYNNENEWNLLTFISNGSGAGVPDWQVDEFRVGTEWIDVVPSIPDSVPLSSPPPPPPVVSTGGSGSFGNGLDIINWTTAQGSGYVYSVWFSTNLLNGFQPLETNLPDTVQSITNAIDAPSVFYKIEAQQ